MFAYNISILVSWYLLSIPSSKMCHNFETMTNDDANAFVEQYNSLQLYCTHATEEELHKLRDGSLLVLHTDEQADGTYFRRAFIISHLIL